MNFTKQRILNRFRAGVTDFNIARDMEICYRFPASSCGHWWLQATASNSHLSEKFLSWRINFELEKVK